MLAISALVFGVAFFAVVGSTTAFVRFNYPPAGLADRNRGDDDFIRHRPDASARSWSAPITDAMGSLSFALNVSAAMLALGAHAVGVSAEA